MDSGERGMNLVPLTIINPGKEYWPSQWIEPATSYSQVPNATELWCSAHRYNILSNKMAFYTASRSVGSGHDLKTEGDRFDPRLGRFLQPRIGASHCHNTHCSLTFDRCYVGKQPVVSKKLRCW